MRRTAGLLCMAVVVLAACGGSGAPSAETAVTFSSGDGKTSPAIMGQAGPAPTGSSPSLDVRTESELSPLPEVVVRDVASGDLVQLKNLLPRSKPLLVWFWAPH